VLDLVEERGRRMFSSARRAPLWAPGLDNALKVREISKAELAGHLGVTLTQVQRWIDGIDQVTPEMQDRLAGWLDVLPIEVFTSRPGNGPLISRYAYCLNRRLTEGRYDPAEVAAAIHVPPETLANWANLDAAVPPKYQHALVKVLETDFDALFCAQSASTGQQRPAEEAGQRAEPSPEPAQDGPPTDPD
jgi:plasmid maintenance system antidote protein VapI